MRIVDLTVQTSTSKKTLTGPETTKKLVTQPSRWGTTEFKLYYLIAVIVIPLMAWIPIAASSGE